MESMDYNIVEALQAVTREKNVESATLIESLVVGLESAAKKKVGLNADVHVHVDLDSGEIEIIQRKTVVEKVIDHETQISLEDARLEYGAEIELGDVMKTFLDYNDFGRNAIGVAKQVLMQKVRDAERTQIYEQFRDQVGDVVVGTVQQVDKGNIYVTLGRVEALLPYRERIRGENYHQGKTIKAFIIEVQNSSRGPQVILSRTHPGFLKSLFEAEVPEIEEGIVQIKAVAREPGTRSKIAVVSHDERVDAVGSCVGMKGSRVQAVTRELSGEKIDIVPYSEDPMTLITRALSPARVNQILADEDHRAVTAIVDDDQLSLAIGREGKNVRLAAKLTGWKIDLVSASEHHMRQRLADELSMDISQMSGVDEALAATLHDAGIRTVEEMAQVNEEQLTLLAGIQGELATTLIRTAQATLEELRKQVEEMIAREKEQTQRDLVETGLFGGESAPEERKLAASDLFGEDGEQASGSGQKKLTEEDLFRGENKSEG
jgi:transcription termination/antitermination protein NusA